jgi:hypothetical protein
MSTVGATNDDDARSQAPGSNRRTCALTGPPRKSVLLSGKLRCEGDRLELAGQRPSSLNAGGLIVVGRSSTQIGPDASAQSVGRVARLSGNVRQPNHVLAN